MKNVLDLIRQKGIEPVKASSAKGGEYHSACPRSGCCRENGFHVWPEQNEGRGSFWCRGCDKGGDNITFVMEYDGLSYRDACKALDMEPKTRSAFRTPRLQGPKPQPVIWQPEPVREPPLDLWIQRAEKLATWAHECLLANPAQMEILASRGIREESVKKFRLGWNPGKKGKDLFRSRKSWGLPTELKDNGREKALWIPIGLFIPLLVDDIVHRIRIRRPDGNPRYYVLPGSGMQMMITRKRCRAYTLVESELDAILIDQAAGDLTGAVALGSDRAKPDTTITGSLRDAAIILNAIDFDEAGHKAFGWWGKHFPRSERWPVPVGKDPGDACREGLSIRDWILAGLPPAWHLDGLDKQQQSIAGGASFPGPAPVADAAPGPQLPEGVQALAQLLKGRPVQIYYTAERVAIQESPKWARCNPGVSNKISQLVYFNSDVQDYLSEHPQDLINGNNFYPEAE